MSDEERMCRGLKLGKWHCLERDYHQTQDSHAEITESESDNPWIKLGVTVVSPVEGPFWPKLCPGLDPDTVLQMINLFQ